MPWRRPVDAGSCVGEPKIRRARSCSHRIIMSGQLSVKIAGIQLGNTQRIPQLSSINVARIAGQQS